MTPHERAKLLKMIDGWSENYLKRLGYLTQVTKEFSLASQANESVQYDLHLMDCLGQVQEMMRDMRILLRMREVSKVALKQKQSVRYERLLVEFFHARKVYAQKWLVIEDCVGDIMGFLQSTTES